MQNLRGGGLEDFPVGMGQGLIAGENRTLPDIVVGDVGSALAVQGAHKAVYVLGSLFAGNFPDHGDGVFQEVRRGKRAADAAAGNRSAAVGVGPQDGHGTTHKAVFHGAAGLYAAGEPAHQLLGLDLHVRKAVADRPFTLAYQTSGGFLGLDRAGGETVFDGTIADARESSAGLFALNAHIHQAQVPDDRTGEGLVTQVSHQGGVFFVHPANTEIGDGVELSVDLAFEPAVGFVRIFVLVAGEGRHPALALLAGGGGDGLSDGFHQRAHVNVLHQNVAPVPGSIGLAVLIGVGRLPSTGEEQKLLRRADLIGLGRLVVDRGLGPQGYQGLRVPDLFGPPALRLLGEGARRQQGQQHGQYKQH